jgi:hypothetical protein
MLPLTQTVIRLRTSEPRAIGGRFLSASSSVALERRAAYACPGRRDRATSVSRAETAGADGRGRRGAVVPGGPAQGSEPTCRVRNEMLCIGKRTNYDAQVLAQVSGRSRIGVPTGLRSASRPESVPGSPHPRRAGQGRVDSGQMGPRALGIFSTSAATRHELRASLTSVPPVPESEEPARHIRKVASLVEYRPVFAW